MWLWPVQLNEFWVLLARLFLAHAGPTHPHVRLTHPQSCMAYTCTRSLAHMRARAHACTHTGLEKDVRDAKSWMKVFAYIVMTYRVMAYIVMAYVVMTYIVMAYVVMAWMVMA